MNTGETRRSRVGEPIPLVDLRLQHSRVADDVQAGFERVLANTSFILGPEVEAFERFNDDLVSFLT